MPFILITELHYLKSSKKSLICAKSRAKRAIILSIAKRSAVPRHDPFVYGKALHDAAPRRAVSCRAVTLLFTLSPKRSAVPRRHPIIQTKSCGHNSQEVTTMCDPIKIKQYLACHEISSHNSSLRSLGNELMRLSS